MSYSPAAAVQALECRILLSTYYVSTAGSDAAPGTLAQPFRTIAHAGSRLRPGDTALIRGGVYRETVRPARSGTAAARVTFAAYPGERVTVSGADVVGNWSAHAGSVSKARQSWDLGFGNNQVFVDGRMMIEARWPNTTLDVTRPRKASADDITVTSSAGADPATATLTDVQLTQPAGTWDGATIHVMSGHGWVGQTGTVAGSAPGKLTYTYKPLDQKNQVPRAGDAYYLTCKFAALDAPGEWFYESASRTLYLRTPGSDSPAGHTVEVKRRQFAFDLRDRSYVDVKGFDLFAATITSSAASSSLRLSNLNASYVSHFTLQPDPWGQQQQSHNSGILLLGRDSVIKDSRITYSAGNGVFLGGSRNRVENCVISNVAYNAGDEAGVYTLGPGHVVLRNTISHTGRSGVVHRYSPGAKILHNLIHTVLLQTTDGGGTYTWGSDGAGTEIAYNRIYNVKSGGFGAAGVYLDNFSRNHVVHHNVVWDSDFGLKMNPPNTSNRIYNNTFAGNKYSVASSGTREMTGSVFRNNLFTNRLQIGPGAVASDNLGAGSDFRFVNAAAGDFRLSAGSAVIDRGVAIAPYTNGHVGVAPDLGAYEYGKTPWTAGAVLPAVPPPVPRRDARGRIEAESFDAQRGVIVGGGVVGSADGGDWVRFGDVDFGAGVGRITARIAALRAGRFIDVRVGSPTGRLAGTLTTSATGGWSTYTTQSTAVSGLAGRVDLYLVFRGGDGVANLDWITFV
jgi:hypothetical protein